MKLTGSLVDVFLSTLDQQSPKTAKPLGRLTSLVNTKVTKYENPRAADGTVTHVTVEKRDGFAATPNTVRNLDGTAAGTLFGQPQVLFEGDVLRLVAGNRLFTKSANGWVIASSAADGDAIVLPQTVRTADVYAADSQCEAPDMAIIGNVSCTVWRELARISLDNNSASPVYTATALDGVRVMFRANGAPVRPAFVLDPSGATPNYLKVRVFAYGGQFWVLQDYNSSGTVARIYVTVFDTNGVQIASTHVDSPSQGLLWDATVIPGTGIVIAMPNNGTGVKFTSYSYSSGFVTASNTDTTLQCGRVQCAWLTDDSQTNFTGYLATCALTGGAGQSQVWCYKVVSLVQTHQFPVVAGSTIPVASYVFSGITGYTVPGTSDLIVAVASMKTTGLLEQNTYGAGGTDPQNTTASNNYPDQCFNTVNTAYVPFTAASTVISGRASMSLVSRAFSINGDYVALGYYPSRKWGPLERAAASGNHVPYRPFNPSDFQPTWYVLPLASKQPIAGRLEYGLAAADWQVIDTTGTPGARNRCLTHVPVASDGALMLPMCYRAEQNIPTPGATSNVASGTNPSGLPAGAPTSFLAAGFGAALTALSTAITLRNIYQTSNTVGVREFRIGPDCGEAFEVGKATYWPGLMAAITEPGEATVTEHGLIAPECPYVKLSAFAATNIYAAGAYYWRAVTEYTTTQGKTYQSIPSAAFAYTIKAGDNLAANVLVDSLSQTNKKGVTLALYRTGFVPSATVGSGIATQPPSVTTPTLSSLPTSGFYKVTSDLAPFYNVPAAGPQTFSDYLESYTQGTGQALYTDSGALPKFPAPAFRAGCVWQNRAWVVGYDNAVWYSGEISEGQGEWFNPGFRVVIPTTEEVRTVRPMEGFLLIGCERSWWYVPAGQTLPDATGAGTAPTPIRLPFEMGTTGFAAVIKQGCLYSSSAGGVWMITRALNNQWVGQAAQDDLAVQITGMCVAGNYVVVTNITGANARVLTFDTNLEGWSAWEFASDGVIACQADGVLAWADDGRVWQQAPGTWLDVDANAGGSTTYVPMSGLIAPVHIGGVRSWKRTWEIQIQGDVYDACNLNVTLFYGDGGDDPDSRAPKALVPGPLVNKIRPLEQLATSTGIVFADSQGATLDTGRGFSLEVASFYVGLEKGPAKLPKSANVKT